MVDTSFLLSFLLVLIAIGFSYRLSLGVEKALFFNSLRALAQLLLLGSVLLLVFEIQSLLGLALVMVFMGGFAAYTANQRAKIPRGILYAFLAIFAGAMLVIIPLAMMGVIDSEAEKLIPLSGMMIGNSMNIYTLFVDRLRSEAKSSYPLFEAKVSLGVSIKEAMHETIQRSIRAAMKPLLNNLQTMGIVLIPGIMTGMLLSGMPPLVAASYQVLIVYMLVGVSLFTAVIASTLLAKQFVKQ